MVRAFTNSWVGGFVEFDAEFKFAKIQNSHLCGVGGFVEFDAEFKFAKIQNSHLWVGGFVEFDAEFKFAKIQNSHLWVGGFVEFDAEFKFAKIQNSHLWVGGGGLQNLMLSSNLLKTKILICGGGGGFPTFDAESKFAKRKKFLRKKFSDKNWNGFVLGFEYRVVRYTSYSEPQTVQSCTFYN